MKIRTTSVAVVVTLAASAFFIVATPVRAHALVLDTLRDTTQSVIKQLTNLGGTSSQNPSVTTPPSSSASPATSQTTTSPAPAPSSAQPGNSGTSNGVQPVEPLPLVTLDIQRLPASTHTSNATFASTNLPAQTSRSSSSQGAFLQATPEGWRVMGLLWYWWLIAVSGLLLFVLALKRKAHIAIKHKLFERYHKVYAR